MFLFADHKRFPNSFSVHLEVYAGTQPFLSHLRVVSVHLLGTSFPPFVNFRSFPWLSKHCKTSRSYLASVAHTELNVEYAYGLVN